ncbi:integral membrane protein [Fusarium mundagurra]|uniref:Integral membrane protein n=1 Tax=Fusarium mundagurra TaxID=1567541 RepID=A0A8H5Z0T8_9HYPO|nr:integral membrane protein [Fusarium mundagurra]
MSTIDPGVNIYNTSVSRTFSRRSLVLRYATSALVVKEWELDVVLITLAWATALGYFISVCFMMKYGWGSHAWDVSLADMVQYNKYLSPTTLTYMWSPTLTKLSILSVLYRISPARGYQISVYVIAVALLIYTITFTVLLSGPCNPKDVGSGVCLNNLAISQVVLNITTDLSIIILPLPTLHNLQIPFRQKVVVGCILSIASAVLIASIVRAPYVHIMAINPDFTRKQAEAGVWSLVELNMGIVCNNLMRLKPFLRTYLPRVLTFLGLTAKSKQQGENQSKSKSSGNWRGRPSHSYQLNSLEHDDPHHRSFRKEPSVEAAGLGDLDKEPSHHSGSTDDILRS